MEAFAIHHNLYINSTRARIFEAITQPKQLIKWWPKGCQGKPELDEIYNFYFAPEYDWYGKVIKVQQNKSFYIKMIQSDDNWNPTSFGFELKSKGNGVTVMFSHEGWPSCNAEFRESSYCWAILLNSLKNYLEKGIIVPFEDRE